MTNSENLQLINQGYDLIKQGKTKEAVQLFEKLIKTDENNFELFYSLAYSYFAEQKYKDALETLDQILAVNDKFDKAYYLSAKIEFIFTNKKDQMTNDILRAIKLNPENSFYQSLAAQIFYSTNNFNNAYKRANEAIKLDPNNYEAYLVLGAYYKKSDPAKSLENFRKALELGPNNFETTFIILPLHLEITKSKQGLKLLSEFYSKNIQNQAYRWLFKKAYFRNHLLNWPFTIVENISLKYQEILLIVASLLIIIAVMYSSEDMTIYTIEAFKWFCSLILIIFVPYQLFVFTVLQIYFELFFLPASIKNNPQAA